MLAQLSSFVQVLQDVAACPSRAGQVGSTSTVQGCLAKLAKETGLDDVGRHFETLPSRCFVCTAARCGLASAAVPEPSTAIFVTEWSPS